MNKQRLGLYLKWSALVALLLITTSVCITLRNWIGDESMYKDGTAYRLSVLNGILGFYAWSAFWTGAWMRSRGKTWQLIVFSALLLLGLFVFATSMYDVFTVDRWRWE